MTSFISKNIIKILCALFALSLAAACVATYLYQKYFPGPILADHSKWGMLGDFFGGILNPIFSLLALLALLLTIVIQSKEQVVATLCNTYSDLNYAINATSQLKLLLEYTADNFTVVKVSGKIKHIVDLRR